MTTCGKGLARRPLWIALLWIALGLLLLSPGLPAQVPTVVRLTLHDTVQPVTAGYLRRGLVYAAALHAQAVLVSLGTPGGLLDSTRDMVSAIESSPVPVIVFVEPPGSRAGSAGFFLLEAADLAAMAPGTNAGAAHPVLEGATMDPVLKAKLENDAAAFLRASVTARGRNAQAAEDAVRSSRSYSAAEALDARLIDLIAPDEPALLRATPGLSIHRFNGAELHLDLSRASVIAFPPSIRERLLTRLTNPDLDVLLLICGALLIYLDFHVPGTVVPGALGTLLVLLAVFGLNLLPIRHTAVLLLAAALVLVLLEAKFASHGALAVTGIACLVLGLATLVDSPAPELRVHLATAVAAGAAFGGISALLAWIALRARRNKRLLGAASMIGRQALALTNLAPAGQVEVRGEIWQAVILPSDDSAAAGSAVLVHAVEGLTLTVSRIP
ncbi:MAG: nodulation protein NfeD [Acidobacteriota bacterium]|nr:nodulation protein NfeD [Acidobacteriota bacterium]